MRAAKRPLDLATRKSLESSLSAVELTSKCPSPGSSGSWAQLSTHPGDALIPVLPSPPWMTQGNPDPFSELLFPQLQSEDGKFHFLEVTRDWCVRGKTMMPALIVMIQVPRGGVCGNVLSQAG